MLHNTHILKKCICMCAQYNKYIAIVFFVSIEFIVMEYYFCSKIESKLDFAVKCT